MRRKIELPQSRLGKWVKKNTHRGLDDDRLPIVVSYSTKGDEEKKMVTPFDVPLCIIAIRNITARTSPRPACVQSYSCDRCRQNSVMC